MMSTFGQRFNQWLVEQGKMPIDDEMVEALNEAAVATAAFMQQHKDEFVAEMQSLCADFVAGKSVDPEARAKALLDRLESS